jgi:hypothetical protein
MQNKIWYLPTFMYKGNGSQFFFLFRPLDGISFSWMLNTGFVGLPTLWSPHMLCCVKYQNGVAHVWFVTWSYEIFFFVNISLPWKLKGHDLSVAMQIPASTSKTRWEEKSLYKFSVWCIFAPYLLGRGKRVIKKTHGLDQWPALHLVGALAYHLLKWESGRHIFL